MTRSDYLILVDRAGNSPAMVARLVETRLAHPGWSAATINASATILTERGCVTTHLGGSGDLAIGHLFKKRQASLSPSARDLPIAARRFLERYWGDYIATFGSTNGEVMIITSPFGQLRLFQTQYEGVDVLASSVAALERLPNYRPTIEWSALHGFLARPDRRLETTSLAGVSRVMPGTAVEFGVGKTSRRPIWDPWDHVASRDNAPSAPQLAETIDACVRDWSDRFRRPLVEVSGGLDSSIIAASLKSCGARFDCATMVPATRDGDELGFARDLTESCGMTLVAREVGPEHIELLRLPIELTPEPGPHIVAQHFDQLFAELATDQSNDAFLNGGGGDNVFARISSAAPVADRWRSGGSIKDCWATVNDIAELTGSTRWAVIRHAITRVRSRSPAVWPADDSFLTDRAEDDDADHAWLDPTPRPLPGKLRHVRAVAVAQSYTDGLARQRTAPIVFPLLSQPIVECCLAVPTWRWVANGRDRAVARDAFAHRLPRSIVGRRSKGALDGLFAAIYRLRFHEIREALLDGLLARHGLLDRAAIERYMRDDRPLLDDLYYRLIELLGHELWARAVEDGGQDLSASRNRA